MIGMIQAFKGFIALENAKANDTLVLCKHCNEKISTHVLESIGGKEGYSCETIIECHNDECDRPREDRYDHRLAPEDVIIVHFNSHAEFQAFEDHLTMKFNIRWYKDRQSNFKLITKRKGQKEHYCRLCKKEIIQGMKVHAHVENGCSFRGRHFSVQNYICEECWNHKILCTKLMNIIQ